MKKQHECYLPPYSVFYEDPIMPLAESLDWGIQKLELYKLHDSGITGKGIKVAVLDTGAPTAHQDLDTKAEHNFTRSSTVKDEVGHGTHVAGIIGARRNNLGTRGVAPECELYIYKVLNGNRGSLSDVAKAIRHAADSGMHIINMSLGSTGDVAFMKQACEYARSKGSIIVVSSGNSGRNQRFYPASYDACLAVGAIDKDFKLSSFSSYGNHLDVVAPGEKILSTYLRNGYAVLSGTSMAAPYVTGMIALMLQAGVQIKDYTTVTKSTIDIEDPDFDVRTGWGILTPQKAIDAPDQPQDPVEEPTYVVDTEHVVNSLNGMINHLASLSANLQSTVDASLREVSDQTKIIKQQVKDLKARKV